MKTFKVSVTKTLTTDIYIQVPDDFDVRDFMRAEYQGELGRIALETTEDYDWDEFEWEKSVEAVHVTPATVGEASDYKVGELRITEGNK